MECDQTALPFLVSFDSNIYIYRNKNSINLEILINIDVFNRAEGKLGRPNWKRRCVSDKNFYEKKGRIYGKREKRKEKKNVVFQIRLKGKEIQKS